MHPDRFTADAAKALDVEPFAIQLFQDDVIPCHSSPLAFSDAVAELCTGSSAVGAGPEFLGAAIGG